MRWGNIMKCQSVWLPRLIIHQQPSHGWEFAQPLRQREKPQEQIWLSAGLFRKIKQPLRFVSCARFLRPFMFNMRFQMPYQLFSYRSLSFSGHLLHLPFSLPKQSLWLCLCLLSGIPKNMHCVFLCTCLCSCAHCRTLELFSVYLCGHRCWVNLLCWMSLIYTILCLLKRILETLFLFVSS